MATTNYNWHVIDMSIAEPSSIGRIITTAISWPNLNKTNTKNSTAANLQADFTAEFNKAKQEIDDAVAAAWWASNTGGTTSWWTTSWWTTSWWATGWTTGWATGWTTSWWTSWTPWTAQNPATWDYPAPQIVFWTNAEAPQAWPDYQTWRNNMIADQIYSQMENVQYATWEQAAMDYYQKLMSVVNSNWGNIQINTATGQITSNDWADYANTSNQIKTKIWQLAWVWSWDQFANRNWSTWGTTGWWQWGNVSDNPDVQWSWDEMQNSANQINDRLENTYNQNMADWQNKFAQIPDVQANITDRLTSMNSAFSNAANNLRAAWDLERKAQAIYSNENINNMKQQLVSKWFDTSKAWPAVFFKAMKDRAQMSADIYKLQADQEKTLANLESQRAQLVDNIKKAWLEADQWVFWELKNITQQIQNVRDNYNKQKISALENYTLQPMLNVFNANYQADLQNITDKYQEQFLNANPSQKVVAAARVFWSDWAYVEANVAMNTSWSFGDYLSRCAQSIREWKIAESAAWADTTNVQWWDSTSYYA